MNLGKARGIFDTIEDDKYTMEEKGAAIRIVIDMETHNSITKDQMLKVMDWMWNQIFELLEGNE